MIFLESLKITSAEMNACLKLHFCENLFFRFYTCLARIHFSEITFPLNVFSRIDICQKLHFFENLFFKFYKCQKLFFLKSSFSKNYFFYSKHYAVFILFISNKQLRRTPLKSKDVTITNGGFRVEVHKVRTLSRSKPQKYKKNL